MTIVLINKNKMKKASTCTLRTDSMLPCSVSRVTMRTEMKNATLYRWLNSLKAMLQRTRTKSNSLCNPSRSLVPHSAPLIVAVFVAAHVHTTSEHHIGVCRKAKGSELESKLEPVDSATR